MTGWRERSRRNGTTGMVSACLLILLLWAIVQVLSGGHARAAAQVPFVVVLPDGTEILACDPVYHLTPALMFEFRPCPTIFSNGFEP